MKHVWWTREVILAITAGAPWTENSVNKLLQNPAEMANVFAPYISLAQQKQFIDLFTTHLKLGGDIVTAAKANDTAKVAELQKQWHENADDIAQFMSGLGLGYEYDEVRKMMYTHLQLTTNEATYMLGGQYDRAIAEFDHVQNEALMMADYFTRGIRSSLMI
jgi:hypothetical protein